MYFVFPDGPGKTNISSLMPPSRTSSGRCRDGGAKYAFEQDALGGDDNLYLFGELEAAFPLTPLTVDGQVGRQDAGRFRHLTNMVARARATFGPLKRGPALWRYRTSAAIPMPMRVSSSSDGARF
jgi:hypothetical protein